MTDIRRPENVWGVDEEYAEDYRLAVEVGRQAAQDLSVVVVSIARTAMPHLPNTLALVKELREGFRDLTMYVYENDSADETPQVLDDFAAAHPWFHVRHDTLGGVDSRGFEPERTIRLAKCRNECHDYVRRHAADTMYTIVLDMDPHIGFSVDGVFTSVYHMGLTPDAAGMASFSLWSKPGDEAGYRQIAHYDAYAARLNWWRDRKNDIGCGWFSMFLPPVGSPPVRMNSAFGGLAVYRTQAFLAAGQNPYEGGDCEHVFLHKRMAEAGWRMYLNPGCRYIAHWAE